MCPGCITRQIQRAKGPRVRSLQIFHTVFHNRDQPSLLLQHQKSCNHGDDSPAARYFVTRVTVWLLCLAPELVCVCSCLDCQCLRMPVSSASILQSNHHLPAPGLCLRAIIPDWLLISEAARYCLQTITIKMKGEKSSVKIEQQKDLENHKKNFIFIIQVQSTIGHTHTHRHTQIHTHKGLWVWFLRIRWQSNISPDRGEQHIVKWSNTHQFYRSIKNCQVPTCLLRASH